MKKTIQAFLDQKRVAIAGASNNKDNFGTSILNELAKKDFDLYPVNPKADFINGVKCYASLADIPDPVDLAIIIVPSTIVSEILL